MEAVQNVHGQLLKALGCHGGVASSSQLLKTGVTKGQMAAGLGANVVLRQGRGIYALPQAPSDLVAAKRSHALLTCLSAAKHYELWVLRLPERLHLCAVHRRLPTTFVDHRWPLATPEGLLPYAPLKDVLLHALRCLPTLEALVMVECAVGRGDMVIEFLGRLLPGNRNARLRSVLDLVELGADSLVETMARVLFRNAGIHVETQVWLQGIGYVDFLLEGFLIIEIDGMTHMEKRQFKKDRRRDNRSVIDGYLVMRYFYEDVVHGPEQMLAEIRQVLGGRPIR